MQQGNERRVHREDTDSARWLCVGVGKVKERLRAHYHLYRASNLWQREGGRKGGVGGGYGVGGWSAWEIGGRLQTALVGVVSS